MPQFKLLTYQSPEGPRAGLAVGDGIIDAAHGTGRPDYASVLGILQDWDAAQPLLEAAAAGAPSLPLAGAVLLPPVYFPTSIYCAGANYSDHVQRMAQIQNITPDPDPHTLGLNPWHFLKPPRSVVGTGATVAAPSARLDWEIELAAVIGRTARNVSLADALEYVAGYTVANDLSARDLARRPHLSDASPFKFDWVAHKCFDGSCPLGPWIVPAADIGNAADLGLKLWVNDVLRQDSRSSRMIFTAAEQIAHLSSRLTLHPGDVVLTGTPSGVGAETNEFLRPGDVVRAAIENIGEITTRIGPPLA